MFTDGNVTPSAVPLPRLLPGETFQKAEDIPIYMPTEPPSSFRELLRLAQAKAKEEIGEFCKKNYGVTFPMTEKVSVKGDDIHPLFQYLVAEAEKKGFQDPIKWNFTKFLLDEKGNLLTVIHNKTKPMSEEVLQYLK